MAPGRAPGSLLAGRSVVASAPALGAGDRRFESCRPDSPPPTPLRRNPVKSAVETLSPTRAKLTVEVPFEEIKPSLDKAYKTIAQQINVPGFRRGKVPPMVIDRQVGRGAVLEQAINEVVPQKYVEALQSHDLQPLAQPDIEVTRMDDNETLEFTAEVDVRPEITVPDYSGLSAEVADAEVSEDDVQEQIEALRERFGSLVDVDRPAADGDFVVIDLV